MGQEQGGGWVYIMANRYRGTIYVGVTSDLADRIAHHRDGKGSAFCAEHALNRLVWAEKIERIDEAIAREKRLKRWRREWKFDLIEKNNPDWRDLFGDLNR
ncbi:GIY-YIG nuclease family protein [Qipengyuania sp. 902]|uniref:GIY-YIG nuclease family protein n=1 Tax=Qipengyuania sp. 902 TaxID=3417565 RepID=UPI003EC08D67